MSATGKLIIFSAPSGSGKTTIVRYLLQETDLPLEFSISATSRQPRGEEVDGKDYYFLTPEAFRQKIETNEFVEYEEVYAGTYYGTLKSEIERIWADGKHVVFDIDVVGGVNLKKLYPEQALGVFVKPPSVEELKRRLEGRGTESPEKVKQRIDKADFELAYASKFDCILINDDLSQAKNEAYQLVNEFIK